MGLNSYIRKKAKEWSSVPKQVETLQLGDLRILEGKRSKVDEFLTLQGKKELSQTLRECFEAWQTLPPLQAENDHAELVLSAVYQQGKIRDFLEKLQAFVDRMDKVDSDDTARDMGYNNYVFFLEQFVSKLKQQYEETAAAPRPEPPACTPDNVAWFISAECGQIAPLQDLPRVRAAAARQLSEARIGQEKTEAFKKAVSDISGALELLNCYSEENLQELRDLSGLFREREQAMRKNIEKGTELYQALTSVMTDAWFRSFDPEAGDSPVRALSRSELKLFYQERLNELKLPAEA